jgi:hypothetical protein
MVGLIDNYPRRDPVSARQLTDKDGICRVAASLTVPIVPIMPNNPTIPISLRGLTPPMLRAETRFIHMDHIPEDRLLMPPALF